MKRNSLLKIEMKAVIVLLIFLFHEADKKENPITFLVFILLWPP